VAHHRQDLELDLNDALIAEDLVDQVGLTLPA
jgi:hypothetical protein